MIWSYLPFTNLSHKSTVLSSTGFLGAVYTTPEDLNSRLITRLHDYKY